MDDMMSSTEVLARLRIDADSEDFEGAQLGPVAVRKLLKHVAALESDRWRQLCYIHSNQADALRRERDELADCVQSLRAKHAELAELAQAREVLRSVECSYSGMLYGDDKAGGPSEYTRGWGDCLAAIKSALAAKGE